MAVPLLRVRFVIDEDARFEECNGEPRPLTEAEYATNAYMKDGRQVLYSDYLRYYGNPDRHVYLGAIVDRQCDCCKAWEKSVASLWNIDCMDDNSEYLAVTLDHPYAIADPTITGYLADVVRELVAEATS